MAVLQKSFGKNSFFNNCTANGIYEDIKRRVVDMLPISWGDVRPHCQPSGQALAMPTNHVCYISCNCLDLAI